MPSISLSLSVPSFPPRCSNLRPLQEAAMAERERQGSAHNFEVAVERDVMVTMRDGVRLATDIYRPARGGAAVPGRFPVLLERTPYDKGPARFAVTARFFAEHGYVVLIQDVRGRGGSEGEWYAFA